MIICDNRMNILTNILYTILFTRHITSYNELCLNKLMKFYLSFMYSRVYIGSIQNISSKNF
jgi:hypothetical protein